MESIVIAVGTNELHVIPDFATLSEKKVDPEKALETAISHWDIENPLHWTLDMVYDEDHSRTRTGNGAENLAILRHMVFNITRLADMPEKGMKRRKMAMTWNTSKLIAAITAA